MSEKYNPSQEETTKAEASMTDEQRYRSQLREQGIIFRTKEEGQEIREHGPLQVDLEKLLKKLDGIYASSVQLKAYVDAAHGGSVGVELNGRGEYVKNALETLNGGVEQIKKAVETAENSHGITNRPYVFLTHLGYWEGAQEDEDLEDRKYHDITSDI